VTPADRTGRMDGRGGAGVPVTMTQSSEPGPARAADAPIETEGVPAEEGFEQAEPTVRAANRTPEEQLSRPDQPGFDPRERDRY
jgi:hypothetical protein